MKALTDATYYVVRDRRPDGDFFLEIDIQGRPFWNDRPSLYDDKYQAEEWFAATSGEDIAQGLVAIIPVTLLTAYD